MLSKNVIATLISRQECAQSTDLAEHVQKIHFFEKYFSIGENFSLKISENPNIFEKSKMFEMFEIVEPKIFVDRKNIFCQLFFLSIVF